MLMPPSNGKDDSKLLSPSFVDYEKKTQKKTAPFFPEVVETLACSTDLYM